MFLHKSFLKVLAKQYANNLHLQMVRLTIRATDESVPPVLLKLMQARLARGFQIHAEPPHPLTKREISDAFGNVLVGSEEGGR